jgi:hypothetical protein
MKQKVSCVFVSAVETKITQDVCSFVTRWPAILRRVIIWESLMYFYCDVWLPKWSDLISLWWTTAGGLLASTTLCGANQIIEQLRSLVDGHLF